MILTMPGPPVPPVIIPYGIGLAGDNASKVGFTFMPTAKEFALRLLSSNVLGSWLLAMGAHWQISSFQLMQGIRHTCVKAM